MNILFMKGEKPVKVEQDGLVYQAGKLSLIGRNGIPGVTNTIRKYLKETYGWTGENQDDLDVTAYGVGDTLLSDAFILILACDYTGQLKPGDLLEWDEDFVDRCFKVITDLNLCFKRKEDTAPETGQAQPETHKEDGTPKTEAETPKN